MDVKSKHFNGKVNFYRIDYYYSHEDTSPYYRKAIWVAEGKLLDNTLLQLKGEATVEFEPEKLPRLQNELDKSFHEVLNSIELKEEKP